MTQSGTEPQAAPVQTMTAPRCTCCDEPEELFLRDDPNDPQASNGAPQFALCLSHDPPIVYGYDVNAQSYISDPTHRVDANTGAIVSNVAGEEPPAGGDFTSDDDDDGLPSPSGGAKVDLSRDNFYIQEEEQEEEEKIVPVCDSDVLNRMIRDFADEFAPTPSWASNDEMDE